MRSVLEIQQQLSSLVPTALVGSVVESTGLTIAVADFPAPVGALATIELNSGKCVEAEVIGFRDAHTLVCPLGRLEGVRRGSLVRLVRTARRIHLGEALLGRVIDARGRTIDGGPQPALADSAPVDRAPPAPLTRPRIETPLATGIRAIDGLLTCGKGQRTGIFAGSGVGKSVLLGMMARYTQADVNVIALIGERGREVNEFIQRELGPEGLKRSVVVVATSDETALVRVQAAMVATAVAEYFRDRGRDVMLLVDSVTRLALAQREIGLAAGEPPTTRGYPPSVFAMLPKLVERAGRSPEGSITAFYSVLVEGDDPHEPISDVLRGLLDGHIWLSRKIAARGAFPAIDVLESLSRLMTEVTDSKHRTDAQQVRQWLSTYRDHEDLISIGAYRPGTNVSVDEAMERRPHIEQYLRQLVEQRCTLQTARAGLAELCGQAVDRAAVDR